MRTKTYYTVVKYDPNTWNMDGSPIVERESGTKHRTVRGAERKRRDLLNYRSGMWSAAWYKSEVVAVDPDGTYRPLNGYEEQAIVMYDYPG